MASLVELLEPHGAPPEGIIELRGAAAPDHVRYLDLRSSDRRGLLAPHGVVEFQDGPLAYVVDATEEPVANDEVAELCRVLAFRGDAPYLTIVEPERHLRGNRDYRDLERRRPSRDARLAEDASSLLLDLCQ